MALNKTPVSINFSQGLDLKTDPFQVPAGKFLQLTNTVFTSAGRLTKRNGFQNITKLPNRNQTTLTTLNDNLIATGSELYAFSQDTNQWLDRGIVQPVQLNVLPLVRVSTSQTAADMIVAPSGLACLVYVDNGLAYYQVSDSSTGQQVINRTALPATASNPRVTILGSYFIITFIATVAGVPTLQYTSLPLTNPGATPAYTTISVDVLSLTAGYDIAVLGNQMFIAWGSSAGATAVYVAYMNTVFQISTPVATSAGASTKLVSIATDSINSRIWVSYWDSGTTNGYTMSFDLVLTPFTTPTQVITTTPIRTITSAAASNNQVFFETILSYAYFAHGTDLINTDDITKVIVAPNAGVGAGTVVSTTVIARSVGLASKAFTSSTGTVYMLTAYGSKNQTNPLDNSNQSTYFLIDSTGAIYMKLAYSNGGGYQSSQVLPNVSLLNDNYYLPYLITDFLTTVNKGTALPTGTPVNAIYTQTGINLAKFSINEQGQHTAEIAGALHLTGGQLWEYDGVKPVEHGFHLYPENISAVWSATGGAMAAKPDSSTNTNAYFYVFTYEWTDNAGNLHRSAPSIPIPVTTTGALSTGSVTLNVPTLRLTYKKAPNPVRIVGYRWSVAQQVYYQFTSVTSPQVNNPAVDAVTITDTLADASILGQTLLYTTGGVIENIGAPPSVSSTLFSNRLFLIDAEDQNLLWFSKQVIQSTPVEMSDLLTLYIAPTTGAQGSTGPMTALSAMDDKLIIFKRDAIYYINGGGPDNTGSNSTFSDPIFVTATVGCNNPSSTVLMPNGIMFQSDKGIWLLGRDLSTTYIGAPVESYNNQDIMSATAIPGTNQVRFIMNNNLTLVYDYFFNQWSTHTNVNAISATLYQGEHTYLNAYGQIFQEQPNFYLDGSAPVLMSLTSSWINIAGLQGYERFYFGYLLGTYLSPFKLNVTLAFDYNNSLLQNISVTPDNFTKPYGGEAFWGSGGPWGGPGVIFESRFFPSTQKCESFQVSIQEMYDSSFNQPAGAGLTLSGLNLIVGMKKGYRTQKAKQSFG